MKRALLFSGGLSPKRDKPRYKSNLLVFHRLLREQFAYENDQIRVCLAGGGDSDFSPNALAATKDSFLAQLAWLAEAEEQDTICLFASNHGEEDGLCLWQERSVVSPQEIETVLSACAATKVLIFGQCHSGIFGQMNLSRAVVCCACGDAESSYPTPDLEFDEFVYHMIGALSGVYPGGALADDSLLPSPAKTLYDAYKYASRKDRTMVTPIFFPDPQLHPWVKKIVL
jgi:hypothetical protein